MADRIKDGGPAFPVSPEESRGHVSSVHGGMSLRDCFAIAALPCVHNESMVGAGGRSLTRRDYEDIAADAYMLADAMLGARSA